MHLTLITYLHNTAYTSKFRLPIMPSKKLYTVIIAYSGSSCGSFCGGGCCGGRSCADCHCCRKVGSGTSRRSVDSNFSCYGIPIIKPLLTAKT